MTGPFTRATRPGGGANGAGPPAAPPTPTSAAQPAPAASLLSVPIFRTTGRVQLRPGSEPAPTPPTPANSPGEPRSTSAPAANCRPASRVAEAEGQAPAGGAVGQGPPPPRDLRRYWQRLARGGPALIEDLDADLIGAQWPHSMLIRVPDNGLLDVVKVFDGAGQPSAANGDGTADGGGHPFEEDRCSQLSAWVLELARTTARADHPCETTGTFRLGPGVRRFLARVLPCRSREDRAPYVLVNVSRMDARDSARRA